tara:strand:- start:974 stop:1969 length:996 start_codon:yes stop_codon:yes gene_type:complete
MANTGFILNPTASQYFSSGPDSGSIVNTDYDVGLYISQSSFVTLAGTDFYYKIYNPETCELTQTCGSGRIINVTTGSVNGHYDVQYSTGSATDVDSGSIDVSGVYTFDTAFNAVESYFFTSSVNASGTGSLSITSSIYSDRVFFRHFNSCSIESVASNIHVLRTVNPIPVSNQRVLLQFSLDNQSFVGGAYESDGNVYGDNQAQINSYTVTITSDTNQTINGTSMVVTAGSPPRTYFLTAGETITVVITYNTPGNLDGVFSFNGGSQVDLPPNGNDILGKVSINSIIFNTVNQNFSDGYILNSPGEMSISAAANLDDDYILDFVFGNIVQR